MRQKYFCVFLIMFFYLVPAAVFGALSPHGDFSAETSFCETCHVLVQGYQDEINKFCFYCHDGTSPGFNIIDDFYPFPYMNTATGTLIDSNSVEAGTRVEFVGETTSTTTIAFGHWYQNKPLLCIDCHSPHVNLSSNPRLLFIEKEKAGRGFGFCYACHSAKKEKTKATSWIDEGYQDSAHNRALNATTITLINCLYCHISHSSDKPKLLNIYLETSTVPEGNICFRCHVVENEIFTYSSHHPVSAREPKIACESCHNPHLVTSASSGIVSNPVNTYETTSTGVSFCLSCHGGKPPKKVGTKKEYVPLTIKFSNIPGPFFQGWNMEPFLSSAHNGAGLTCGSCHDPHGSRNLYLLALNRDNSFNYAEEKLCFSCHNETGPAQNTLAGFNKPYTHPVTITYLHRAEEDYGELAFSAGNSRRHAECQDCHNAHKATTGTFGADELDGALLGIGGVDSNLRAIKTIEAEYQLCYKCHSSFTVQPPGQGDKRAEFDTRNASYHPVEGRGANQIEQGAFVEGYSSESVIKCSDCHGGSDGTLHGSDYEHILKKPYSLEAANGPDALCFDCHRYEVYAGSDNSQTRFGKHYLHASRFSCYVCHLSHGSAEKFLIADSFKSGSQTYRINFTLDSTGASCGVNPNDICHSKKTYPREY